MNAADIAGDLVLATPQGRTAKAVIIGVGSLLAIACLIFVIWWIFVRPHAAQVEAAGARAEAIVADHGEKSAGQALRITLDVGEHRTAIDATTRENDHAIKSAADAATRNPDVARALHDALCLRDAYQSEPDCAALQTAGRRVSPPAADTGSRAPGR